jgi:hypothetical protein
VIANRTESYIVVAAANQDNANRIGNTDKLDQQRGSRLAVVDGVEGCNLSMSITAEQGGKKEHYKSFLLRSTAVNLRTFADYLLAHKAVSEAAYFLLAVLLPDKD